jgi:general secretion pathway protein D
LTNLTLRDEFLTQLKHSHMTTRINRSTSMKLAAHFCLVLALGTSSLQAGGVGGSNSGLAEREMARRMARVQEAQAAIERGDKLMADGDCEGALNEYKTALDLLPDAPMTAQLRDIANAKYCEAAVCLAEERAKSGRYQDARSLLNDALVRHPDCASAKTLLVQLDDPERYEPALTPEHTKNVEEVSRNLQLAYSYLNLGDYDNATKIFQEALRIDKYNAAARRGMEQVDQKRAEYYSPARDQARAEMLNEVNRAWEKQVPISVLGSTASIYEGTPDASRYYTEKMGKIIFPTVSFQGASVDEAIEFLRIKSRDYDTVERDPSKRGVNLILRQGSAPSTAQISLDLRRFVTSLNWPE